MGLTPKWCSRGTSHSPKGKEFLYVYAGTGITPCVPDACEAGPAQLSCSSFKQAKSFSVAP